ncbi:zinc-ribbon domain-containing protein [Maribellus comscasis]|uniref:Zinc-ribbon domain-containing protein n=1 Tax=Maribellus comscasis TaxID=2681766 RepID=A0A6I6K4A8_9BACT|nr:zinc-ribbon domain-containing protein [Maribellus comscasis]QGY47282.1 zinc-ribbon domain-containing protein [Maribellus comscasis]
MEKRYQYYAFISCSRKDEKWAKVVATNMANQPVADVKYCPECGAKATKTAKFCSECGGRF